MKEDTYPLETHELVYNVVKDALNTQFQSLDRLNTIQKQVLSLDLLV